MTTTPQAVKQHHEQTQQNTYNYPHFHPRFLMKDVELTADAQGPLPGDEAPEISLQDTEGHPWRLSEQRGQPTVLILGSASCPITEGGLPAIKEVYRDHQDRTNWALLYVREAHPGEHLPAHRNHEQKQEQAAALREAHALPWPVLVDEVDGATHRAYGLLPNSVFLIDAEGRVAFRGDYSHGPTLRKALEHLFTQEQQGVVPEGKDPVMHMLGATAFGWDAITRSGQVAVRDVAKGMPPLAANLWLGARMRPLIAPLAARSHPLPPSAKAGFGVGLGLIAGGVWKALRQT